MSARLVLLRATVGLVPIAVSYGLMPGSSIPVLAGYPVERTN